MRYELETIPIWDALKSDSECFICSLMQEAQADSLRFYLGSSVMNPSTRAAVNETGFCAHHYDMLIKEEKPHALAVMEKSHFQQTIDSMDKAFDSLLKSHNPRKALAFFDGSVIKRNEGCLICQRMEERLNRYAFTTAYLWARDEDFRKALEASKGLCLEHLRVILKLSSDAMDARLQKLFLEQMRDLEKRNFQRLMDQLDWMTDQYKAENRERPWNGCENSQKRIIYKQTGQGLCKTTS